MLQNISGYQITNVSFNTEYAQLTCVIPRIPTLYQLEPQKSNFALMNINVQEMGGRVHFF